jgi:NADPH:quinone reductase-like Zn-dependent oxidoreductase
VVLPHLPGVDPAGVVDVSDDPALPVGTRVVPYSHLACGRCLQCLAGFDNACPHIRVLGVQTPGCGGYADYFCWPSARLLPFSEVLSFETAAALLVNYGPVWFGLIERAGLKPGDTVVVTGAAGGCGHAALDIGRLYGTRTIAVTRATDKAPALRAAGADEVVVDHGDGRWADAVADLTHGKGADCVVELVGAATWKQSVQAAGLRGRIVVIGSHAGLQVDLNLGELFGKNLAIHGITRANRVTMERLLRLAERGRLRPSVAHLFNLEEAAAAHALMESGRHVGKIILRMT